MNKDYTLHPGIVKVGGVAISPYCLTATVILRDGQKLSKYISTMMDRIRKSKLTTFKVDKYEVNSNELKRSNSITYSKRLDDIENIDTEYKWKLDSVDACFDPVTINKLTKASGYYTSLVDVSNNKLFLKVLCEDISQIRQTIKFETSCRYNYYIDDIVGSVDCVLEVGAFEYSFQKINNYLYRAYVHVNDKKLQDDYKLIVSFDEYNISKFSRSGSRYCVAEWTEDGNIIIESSQPFEAIAYIILCKKI